ncbi:trypsin-like serine protease [Zhihengliuella sp.]|uniref:trypsin-like serine peptidase n=1 Tax=Zhihengliuella sp. TaxID=1954483 RepID=UPI0028119D11|nr:trypsin-like serine protease [Zhihengliuella sp.]
MRPQPPHETRTERGSPRPTDSSARPSPGRRRRAARTAGALAAAAALFLGGIQPASASLLGSLAGGVGLGVGEDSVGLEVEVDLGPQEDRGSVSAVVAAEEAAAAVAYWTPERMRLAQTADALVADKIPSTTLLNLSVELGQPTRIRGNTPVLEDSSGAGGAPEAETQSDGTTTEPASAGAAETPVPHIGKVFFTMNGSDYVCSGNAVASANESTVATAGHCLHDGPGSFASRFVFVPAYQNGSTPYGKWAATELHTTPQWAAEGDLSYDGGFAVVAPQEGASLSDTVGASGLAFNQARGQTYTAYGYPAGAPFDGETLQSCHGTATDDPHGQTASQGIPCDMTGGSSGGPWFLGDGSGGYQNSVNSFRYSDRETMFGPYFGSDIQRAYQQAER